MRTIFECRDDGGDTLKVKYQGIGLLLIITQEDGGASGVILSRAESERLVESLGSVVEPKGGESGASVPAPAVPMEGEPGPGVQLGPARASIGERLAKAGPDFLDRLAKDIGIDYKRDDYPRSMLVDEITELRALVARYQQQEPPSRWLPPNASDTHAPAPRTEEVHLRGAVADLVFWPLRHVEETRASAPTIGQATMAGYPEPWEDEAPSTHPMEDE